MDDLISRQAAIDALDVLCQEHRYKIPGKSETYSEYNEAWQDALDRAEGLIFNLPSAQPDDEEANYWHEKANSYEQTLVRLSQSIAEQPEIIRCKDCKWWAKQKDSLQGRCELMKMYPTGGWFCANARKERR